MCVYMLSRFSHVQLLATLWTVVFEAPLSLGFSRQEYWSGLPRPPPGDLPDQGLNPHLVSLALAGAVLPKSGLTVTTTLGLSILSQVQSAGARSWGTAFAGVQSRTRLRD